jgi:tetratricopeptide (TPR) repeat protein
MNISLAKPIAIATSIAATLILTAWSSPSLAGDPFRTSNPRNIGDKTEAAFDELFEQGNYTQAKVYLVEATEKEPNEPLAHAMRASLAYTEKDWENLRTYAQKTITTAEKLKTQDPLRGNLYLAVGNFLDGAYVFEKEGAVAAISKLPQVLEYFEAAEKASPNDPELNLLKGYSDLMLAVNLPFSDPQQTIDRLETYASPKFLVNRGIALAYRDMKQYDKAIEYLDQDLAVNPDNPELKYLKGQFLRSQGKKEQNITLLKQALDYYNLALEKQNQLPANVIKSLQHEYRKVQAEIQEMGA